MSCTRHEMTHQLNTYEKARTQHRQLQSFSTCITKQTVFCCLSAEYCVTVFYRCWQRFQACYFLQVFPVLLWFI